MDTTNDNAVSEIDQFLTQQESLDTLRLMTCGSVDDGKSTLIGRLIYEAAQIFDDQVLALEKDSAKHGTQGEKIDYALLVDGLEAEREQGITIDVAYRYIATSARRFIIADTPGHQQYTRNMVTAASTSQVAILLVDARQGILTQTRRHAYLVSMLGVKHVVLAVNKMDLTDYDQTVFLRISQQFEQYVEGLNFDSVTAVPISALEGENIVSRPGQMPWFHGPTLLGYLETVETTNDNSKRFALPVQTVLRPHSSFRGFAGTVAQGIARPGDAMRVAASGATANIKSILFDGDELTEAVAGQAIVLTLDREVDASRGDVFSTADDPIQMSDQFEATIVWMSEDTGMASRSYDLRLGSSRSPASITRIRHRINVDTMSKEAAQALSLNDIAVCTIATDKPIAYDTFEDCAQLGSFILVDRISHATVAAGLIHHSLRRASNVHRQLLSITRQNREELNGHPAKVIWFTGLSGSGKSTIANALELALHKKGYRTFILDGDNIRQGLNRDLGFTDADRIENIRRIAEVAKLMLHGGQVVMTAFISPFERERQMARELIGPDNFVEVFVNTPLSVCESRDVKGLYKKARDGKLPNLSGIGSPYQEPLQADLTVHTETEDLNSVVDAICQHCRL